MRKRPKPWTYPEIQKAVELWRDGLTDRDAGLQLGRSREQMSSLRCKMKIAPNRVDMSAQTKAATASKGEGGTGAVLMDRNACIIASTKHLADLLREYGGGTLGRAKAVYRARCEWQIEENQKAATVSHVTRFDGSSCSSAMGWL